jgi:hypothetical protein
LLLQYLLTLDVVISVQRLDVLWLIRNIELVCVIFLARQQVEPFELQDQKVLLIIELISQVVSNYIILILEH